MSYLVLVIYWILSVLSTYIVRYYNNKNTHIVKSLQKKFLYQRKY